LRLGLSPHRRASAILLLFLLIATAGLFYGVQSQSGNSRTWFEVNIRPTSTCYQGRPRRELVHWQLWSGGPALRVFEERQIRLPP
jgi:hypothetical protein